MPVDVIGDWGEGGELEIIESVEPPRSTTTESSTTVRVENPSAEEGGKRGAISLRRLMTELLKLDRVPRPFSSPSSSSRDEQQRRAQEDAESRARILYDVLAATTRRGEESWVPRSSKRGEEILDRLAENLGESLYRVKDIFDLPGEERAVDFHEGTTEEASTTPSTTTTAATKVKGEGTVNVVKTEFVPSLGFSLDTDEGREEYVEAVLGGLIEPRAAGKEEEGILERSFERKNETLEGKAV